MLKRLRYWLLCFAAPMPVFVTAQPSDTVSNLTLQQCIRYALENQPALKQSYIDEAIQRANINISLSSWLPQAALNANLQHYFELPTTITTNFTNPSAGKIAVTSGVFYSSTPQFAATENIFNSDVLYAVNTSKYYKRQSKENIASTKISLVANVSKAFYNVLVTSQQINILKEDTARLRRSLKDAYNQYQGGIVDKVDYKRAQIALNNSEVQLKTAQESLPSKYAQLEQLLGVKEDNHLQLAFDTTAMMQDVLFDTTATLQYENRIEYQQLQTSKTLQKKATQYYNTAFLPSLSAFYNYNPVFQNDEFSQLYNKQYPNSLIGLNLSLPLFQGFKRIENIRRSKLQQQRLDWDEVNLKLQINAEYAQALAGYKSNLDALHAAQENQQIAREVYNVVYLQYREGVKQYLEVITAEADLKTSEINYLNALFQLLSSKIDLQRSMGLISSNL
ncbi:TolC family protein [Chitinophagaceae bacterium MMS25-I14]